MSYIFNPYIAGNPVTGPEMFFGREDVFEFIRQTLIGQHHDNVIVLYGQRRTGKTSVLYQIRYQLDSRYLCIFVDLHGFALESLRGFLWELTNHIMRVLRRDYQINLPPLNRADFMIDPHISFEENFLGHLWSAIEKRHILLMFDEVIRLQERVKVGTLDRDIFEYLRHLMQHHEQLNFLFSLGSGLEEMQEDYAFLFNVALYKKLSFLDPNAASTLITQPVKDYFVFDQAAVEQIMRITSCHPYYLQLLCHCIFNHWQQQHISPITTQMVDNILDETVERGLAVLKHVWEESTDAEKAIMVGIAEIAEEPSRQIETNIIIQTWANHDVILPVGEVAKATRNLVARDVIVGQDKYAFTVDLQRLWVRKYIRLEWVKEEIAERVREWMPTIGASIPVSRLKKWKVPLLFLTLVLILSMSLNLLIPFLLSTVHPPSKTVPYVLGIPGIDEVPSTADVKVAEQIYEQAMKEKPILSLLNKEDSNYWEWGSISSGNCKFTNEAYHVYVNKNSSYNLTYCYPRAYSFHNFVFQVQMTIISGTSGGIIFLANTTQAKWFFFEIQAKEHYDLYEYYRHGSSDYLFITLHGDYNPIIRPKTNELAVIVEGSVIYLRVNGQYLWKQTNNIYNSGNIGLVANSQNPTDIAFSNVKVWNIKS